MSQYFIDKLVYNKDTLDIHDTGAREMIANNTTNIQAVSARVTKNANDIDALEEITTDLREDVDNLDDRMGVAETEIDGLKTRTTNLEGRMNTAENRLDGHDTKISDLEDRMDTAENNIIALDGRMTAAENDIDAAEHRLDLVEAKNDEQDIAIDDLEENVAKNTADIVDIKDDLTGVHKNIEDLDDRITASTYEAGIGIYFGQGAEHTNINVEDEILDQINQNTIDIQNLKTRVTNVEYRLTTVEVDIVSIKGDITDIKAEITSIKADITALDARVTALEGKILPAGGVKGQILKKKSDTDYDVEWGDIETPIYDYTSGDTFVEPIGVNCHMRFHHITASDTFWDSTNLGYYIPVDVAKAVGIITASYIDVEQKLFFDDADNKAYYYYTCKFVYSLSDRPDCILVFTGRRTSTSSINWVLESSTGLDIGRLVLTNATPNFYAETNWYPLLNVLVHNYKLRNVSIRVNNYHVPAGTTAKLTSYDVPIRIYLDGAFGEGCGFTTTFTNMDTSTLYSVNFEYDYATSTWTPTYKSVALT